MSGLGSTQSSFSLVSHLLGLVVENVIVGLEVENEVLIHQKTGWFGGSQC